MELHEIVLVSGLTILVIAVAVGASIWILLRMRIRKLRTNRVIPGFQATRRECEVLSLIMAGNGNKQIARKLRISEQTVKNHVSSLLWHANAANRTDLVVKVLHNKFTVVGINETRAVSPIEFEDRGSDRPDK